LFHRDLGGAWMQDLSPPSFWPDHRLDMEHSRILNIKPYRGAPGDDFPRVLFGLQLPASANWTEIPLDDSILERPMIKERRSLLIVDDNAGNRDLLRLLLQQEGYTVATAKDGAEALQVLQQAMDLVLLDLSMPGLDGFETLKIIRKSRSPMDLPVIMATGSDRSDNVVFALQLGANDYVTKPFDFPVVLARVQAQLAMKDMVEQMRILEGRLEQRNNDLEKAHQNLKMNYQKMKRDLGAAAKIQRAFLPQALPQLQGVHFAWQFQPCEDLAGDTLNIVQLDEEHFGLYILDVSGHGVAAALLSVTLSRILSPVPASSSILFESSDGSTGYRLASPSAVLGALVERFPWDSSTEQYFTIIYGILDVGAGEFRYVSAGHPGLIYVSRNVRPVLFPISSFPIGVPVKMEALRYDEKCVRLQTGDRLYLYSDGVTEARSQGGELFGTERLLTLLDQNRGSSLEESSKAIMEGLRQWGGSYSFKDDISTLAVEYLR
jgi:phosphoserine phosphatase RsbU/P